MSGFLERLGRWCARHPWRTIGVWILIAIVVGGLAASAKGYSESFTIPGTESQQATDLLKDQFPAQAGATAQVVLHSQGRHAHRPGEHRRDRRGARERQAPPRRHRSGQPDRGRRERPLEAGRHRVRGRQLREDRERDQARGPRPSSRPRWSPRATRGCRSSSAARSRAPVSGPTSAAPRSTACSRRWSCCCIAFGSVVAMGVPIGTALVGLAVGLSGVTVMTNFFDISQIATTIATMIGLGVGIDYALFVVTRHREQLASGMSIHDSAGHANGTSGMAVVFAGTTVVIAICGLVVAGIPTVTAMGFASALVVAVSVIAAITLLPALLGLAGTKINSLRLPWVKRNQVEAEMHPRPDPPGHVGAVGRARCGPPVALPHRQPRRAARARGAGALDAPRPDRRGHALDHLHAAPRLRPPRRRLRQGLQRPAAARRRGAVRWRGRRCRRSSPT